MSGHSKWSTIKRKKGALDAKRGRIFTNIIREIITSTRIGGKDISSNPRLRLAVDEAKAANMPKENIERAMKKGAGELEGETYEEIIYEGYGPAGVALLIETLTDNRNRTVSEVRHALSRHGGSLGESGCVMWMFNKKGVIGFSADGNTEDAIMEIALEAGAEDVKAEEDEILVYSDVKDFENVKSAFDAKGVKEKFSEISYIPQTNIELKGKEADQMVRLMDALEEIEGIQNIHANFDIQEAEG
ncbi:MAG: YebC/PmpR family DNA-binding transcriptional regulator [Deltaproteobacteria bacterium]|nr:YebC/PmpR family DNA-binding transcriptional regulator [Deltaproteobacteria bacterium]